MSGAVTKPASPPSESSVRELTRREQLFELAVVLPTIAALVWAFSATSDQLSSSQIGDLVVWVVLTAAVELIPVPTWQGTTLSLGFPLMMVVAFLYPPAVAGAAAFLAASDPREVKREVRVLQALFNRSVIALAVWAASGVFHALVDLGAHPLELVAAALLAAGVDYFVNFGFVALVASLHFRTSPIRIIGELRVGRLSEFVISYLGLSVFGLILAKVFVIDDVGFWTVPVYILPMLLARQMFFRSKALEEAHKELKDREHILRALSNRMAEERQDERLQIAAFLHDDLAQLLFRLSIQVDVTRKSLDAGKLAEAEQQLAEIKETKNRTSDRVRALIRDLHRSPLGHAGLGEAIRSFLAEMGRESTVRFRTDLDDIDLPPPIALLLYHNAREGVMNALKHARADTIWVSLHQEGDEVEMVLRDDGVGFDVSAPGPEGHYGMTMMRERATVGGGSFKVASTPGEGTTITVRFPTSWLQPDGTPGPAEQAAPVMPPAGASRGAVSAPPSPSSGETVRA
jgi:signal transduction histidine kinase